MRFFHISDLHIGKRVCGFSMLEDQRHILTEILELAGAYRPDGILLAGDLYDRTMPPAEAVELADWFLTGFAKMGIPVWAISGNHDCAERVAYGAQMLEQAGICVSRVFDGKMQKYTWSGGKAKDGEKADIYLLPFVRPAQVRRFFPERTIETTQQAIEAILEQAELADDRPNILIMHQFIAGASVCESEEISVGGSDQVSAEVTEHFDYVALGHLHGPQRVGGTKHRIRYCGSPLKYSFSEANQKKSITVVDICRAAGEARAEQEDCQPGCPVPVAFVEEGISEKGWKIRVSTLALTPRRDLREIRGPIGKLLDPEVYQAASREDYLHITLTDREGILDALGKLREVYPNIMRLDFETAGVQALEVLTGEMRTEEKSPQELFEEFFAKQTGQELTDRQRELLKEVWEANQI